ncbi:Uncharacterised protein [Mycobacteroides abscessus subsp. abscessus]|nr:Uncharacterised protein [Mycobacteroides abscessus subsp. abscessus]
MPSVIIPIPPNCRIKAKIKVPGTLRISLTFTVERPVTLMALTEVKKASIKDSSTPSFRVIGSSSSTAERITANK